MKFSPFIFVSGIILIISCGYSEIKNQNMQRPAFDIQKIYYFNKSIFEFLPTYYIYNAKVNTYFDAKDRKEGMLFKISKKADFSFNGYLVTDLKNKMNVTLKENDSLPENGITSYTVLENDKPVLQINQQSRFDFLKYDFMFGNEKYLLEGKIKGTNGITHSFVFTLSREGRTYAYFFKEYHYFTNEHEIIINRNEKNIGDILYVAACTFIEQVLRENGYEFRS